MNAYYIFVRHKPSTYVVMYDTFIDLFDPPGWHTFDTSAI